MDGSAEYPSGYRVLVTGAASGIGEAVVRRLAGRGARVAAADLPGAFARAASRPELAFDVDIADEPAVTELVRRGVEALGGLDAVVNCAGVLGPVSAAPELTVAEFESVLRVNLTGCFVLSRAVLPRLAAAGFGRLVHFASIAGKDGNPGMCAYSASKAGVLGLVKSLGKEYAASGVTVNAIAPGIVDTPLLAGMTDERRAAQRNLVPMGRLGTVDEAAALVEYVISPEASFTTGFAFDLSGGRAVY